MRRPFVTTTCAVAWRSRRPRCLPRPSRQRRHRRSTAPAQPEQPKEPRLTFTGDAGVLLVQVKPDQTAAFEELVAKVRAGLAKSRIRS